MNDLSNVLEFIFFTPFSQNGVFPWLIFVFFGISFSFSFFKNMSRFSEYKKNIDTYILEDYEEGISASHVSGILMSIGIIGTFFLIYDSLSHLNMSDSASMMTMISSEIAPAFSISALGITASIFYVLFEKIFILGGYKRRMSLFKYNNEDALHTYSTTIADDRKLNQMILIAIDKQTKIFASLDNSSHSEALNPEVLGKVISKALLKDLTPILRGIHSITENVNTTSSKINQNSKDISHFLKEELKNDIIIPLKNSVDNTSKSMENIESALEKTSEAMTKTNEGFDKLNSSLDMLKDSQESFVKNLDGVLDKQRIEFEKTTETINNTYIELGSKVKEQTTTFEKNSKIILDSFTDLSSNMKIFLDDYKKDYKVILDKQKESIEETSRKTVELLDASKENISTMLEKVGEDASRLITEASTTLESNLTKVNKTVLTTATQASNTISTAGATASSTIRIAGTEASTLITSASSTLQNTLSGVDEALVKTSDKIQDELKIFRVTYTDTLEIFLETQSQQLEEVFGKNTKALTQIVSDFKEVLEEDTLNRTELNEDLEKLIKTTNIFVNSTKLMITTAFNEQESQLTTFMGNNQSMQGKLKNIIDDVEIINDNGNTLTKELIDTTAELQKQFNKNQIEILKKYQLEVDMHLDKTMGGISEIASGMLEVVQLIHQTKEESEK